MASDIFQSLLPSCVATIETLGNEIVSALFPSEAPIIRNAVPKRRLEFSLGRSCAHLALQQLTGASAAVTQGARREPIWPEGIVGSITHCEGLAAAAVARETDILSIGIDAEPRTVLPPEIVDRVCRPHEIAGAHGKISPALGAKVIFCAKEAVYKCLFPVDRLFLEFEDVDISFAGDDRFDATVARGSVARVTGRWTMNDRHIAAAVTIRHNDP